MLDQQSSTNVPDLNQEPILSPPPVFSAEALNVIIEAESYFSRKADSEIISESRILSAKYVASITVMSQRLLAGISEIEGLSNQISTMSQIIAEKDREIEILKEQNKEFQNLMDKHARDLQSRVEQLERGRLQLNDQQEKIVAEVLRLAEK